MVLYCNTVACFDNFGVAYIPNKKKSYGIKNIKPNIYRIEVKIQLYLDVFVLDLWILC